MIQRNFILGSEWLYYKIYCGSRTGNEILLKLYSLIKDDKNSLQKWFFIRYNDPDQHLRIRFNVEEKHQLFWIQKMYNLLSCYIESDMVWKVQLDTYNRELERYGAKTMEDSEYLFYKNSELILSFLEIKHQGIEPENELLFSLMMIDSFLNEFQLDIQEKYSLLNALQQSFKREFSADKTLKRQLDKEYRVLKPKIKKGLNHTYDDELLKHVNQLINIQVQNTKTIINNIQEQLEIPKNDFLSSHIHMMINRQYSSQQRTCELIIYDYLFRYYKEQLFRKTSS